MTKMVTAVPDDPIVVEEVEVFEVHAEARHSQLRCDAGAYADGGPA
jgi:hypothetical protein